MRKELKLRTLALLLVLGVAVLALAGCGGMTPVSEPASQPPAGDAAGDTIVLRLGLETNPGQSRNNVCDEWVRLISEYTNGSVQVEIYPSAQLGQPNEIFEGMKMGSVDLTVQGTGLIGGIVPAFNIIYLPYRWSSQEQLERFLDSDAFVENMVTPLEEQGIFLIEGWYRTARHLTTRDTPVNTPADLDGVKIRVPDTIAAFEAWKAVGANPQPISWAEVYSGLQQGVVDACEAPMDALANISSYEVCKELILTSHVREKEMVLISEIAYNKLSQEQIDGIYKAAAEAGIWAADRASEDEARYIEEYKAAGVNVITPDNEAFIAATAEAVGRLTDELCPGLDAIILDMK